MVKTAIRAIIASAAVCIFPFVVSAGGEEKGLYEIPLPKKIHRVLSAEMNRVQNAMTNLAIAVPAGHWEDIIETAGKMKEGYIMETKLSKEEMEEFNNALPPGYRALDREYRDAAGRLRDASEKRDSEQVIFHFYKLTESCIRCHAKYATKRFPGLKP